jgi:ACS family D-galactonate transporter-like MFS transporter
MVSPELLRRSRVRPCGQHRWRIAWLLGIGVLVNYFDRVNLSVSQAALFSTFGISAVTFGYLAGAYSWTYALCQLPIGVILDKWGIRRVGRVSIILWTVASFAAAVSPWLGGLFAARLLLGVGEAPTFPANAKAVGRWFPPQERSFATSMFDSAAKLGPAFGVPFLGFLLLRIGWRWSFAVTGALSLLYFWYFIRVYCDPEHDPHLTEAERSYIEGPAVANVSHIEGEVCHPEQSEGSGTPSPTLEATPTLAILLLNRKVIGLAIGFGSYNYVFYLLLTWLPGYFHQARHLDLQSSFLYTGFPWLVAAVADLAIGGWLADTLIQRGWNAGMVRKVILIGGTACGLGILGAAQAHSTNAALLWITLSIAGLSAAAPIGWSIPALIIPRNSVGRVGGIVNFSNQLSGVAAPIVTGYIVQNLHSFTWAFGVAAIYLAIGITAYFVLLGKIEPVGLKA